MVTRVEVSRIAGVSVATVSNVINGTKYVSPELKKKVEEAIRILNYKPNIIARSLATKISKHVGILVKDTTNPYYGEIAQGMAEVASKNGYMISICVATEDTDELFANILQRQMDGLFIATVQDRFNHEQIKKLYHMGVAIVNGSFDIGSYIDFDYYKGVGNLIKYLSDLGHKHIAFLSGLSLENPEHWRYMAFKESMKLYGITLEQNLIIDGTYPYDTNHFSGYEGMKKILSKETRVTAVITTNDLMAFGAMKAIREFGLRIPQDISIAGCDDIFLSECTDPPLTTLKAEKKELGRCAMHLILNEIRKKISESVFLNLDLVIRGSTGPAKKN